MLWANIARVGYNEFMMDSDLVVTGLQKTFDAPQGVLTVLRQVDLHVSAGETVAIIGPSGAGKSTLLQIIGSLDTPSAGSVRLGDCEVTTLCGADLAAFRARRVGFVFQDHHLLPQLTALENVLLPTLYVKHNDAIQTRAQALLARVGVAARATAFPAQLSGGERQRVAIARALMNGAGLLLCDEPTGNLDREHGAAIVSLFLELAEQERVAVIMVTHNLTHAARFSHCLALQDGALRLAEVEAFS